MQKVLGFVLIVTAMSAVAMAGTAAVPEISPASAASGIAIVAGAVLVLRGRRKK
jgi:LPXTG-motif cell wall-anchored protein